MARHVAPERWAERARLSEAEQTAMAEHADGCAPCAAARGRVDAALAAMRDLGAAPGPAVNWELVGARLYWSVSSEMRQRDRPRSGRRRFGQRWVLLVSIGAAAVALATTFVLGRPTPPERIPVVAAAPPAPRVIEVTLNPPRRPVPAPPLVGLVTFLQGDVRLAGKPLEPGMEIVAGAKLQTSEGRLAVQFGERSAFAIGPRTALEIRSFDGRNIVLAVEGTVDLDVEKRDETQRLQVFAGERSVEVRGTAFRVGNDAGALEVLVARGRVAVVEGDAQVEVPAGSRLSLAAAGRLAGAAPRALISPAVTANTRALARIPMVPNWTDVASLRSHTSLLAVSGPPRAAVRVDGMEVGKGTFLLRTVPGRHLVEGPQGGRWIEVEPGTPAIAAVTGSGRSERPGQVDDELRLHRRKFADCSERLRKAEPGFAGSMQVEIGIEADGSVRFVAPVAGLTDPDVESCLLDVIRTQFVFPAGSKATVQKVIRF